MGSKEGRSYRSNFRLFPRRRHKSRRQTAEKIRGPDEGGERAKMHPRPPVGSDRHGEDGGGGAGAEGAEGNYGAVPGARAAREHHRTRACPKAHPPHLRREEDSSPAIQGEGDAAAAHPVRGPNRAILRPTARPGRPYLTPQRDCWSLHHIPLRRLATPHDTICHTLPFAVWVATYATGAVRVWPQLELQSLVPCWRCACSTLPNDGHKPSPPAASRTALVGPSSLTSCAPPHVLALPCIRS
mmetsp:Transcript_20551/g.35326  ORF Transcript_20551/g.35326 Transcript_20551/m.35326 type:complete len:242 (-) Transcript_20551:182-907(-)